ncbi:MAG: ribbon-helix-helix domain-containing protein [Thalassobaculum sp.]|uniref:ribbon-helix-helix domain-containing protein n=1 Tax=Thalassobaculum sp. TaxID=2022740 RepID=UPI0032ECE7AB
MISWSEEAALTSHSNTCHRLRRNVTITGRRTSVSLEGHVWDGLLEVCRREAIGIDALCTEVDRHRDRSSMSSSLRVFLLLYFRTMAEVLEHRPDDRDGLLGTTLDVFRTGERTGQAA